jgi:membrane fusion protein, multidrug efflux system
LPARSLSRHRTIYTKFVFPWGAPAEPENGGDLGLVPPDLDQTFSSVRQAQSELLQSAAELGIVHSFNLTPKQMLEEFYKRDPHGDVDLIFARLVPGAPAVKQAEAKLQSAERDLDQAELNLRYCEIIAEIDGVVNAAMSIPAIMSWPAKV